MFQAKRPQSRRCHVIDLLIRSEQFPTASRLAEAVEVNVRTIHRDLEFMRDSLNAPLEYCRKRKGWYYTTTSYHLPSAQLSEEELVALTIAGSALSLEPGTPFGESVNRSVRALAEHLSDANGAAINRTAASHPFYASAPLQGSLDILLQLSNAVKKRHRLQINYWTASRDATTRREVDPWQLACIDGQWYLLAYCHLRDSVRMFASWRIEAARQIEGDYEVPADFSVASWLADAFQVVADPAAPLETVTLRFSPYAARFIREKRWHISQELRELPGGGVELSLRVASLVELERWVMSWSEHVEAIAPPSLRERIRNLSRSLASRHSDTRRVVTSNETQVLAATAGRETERKRAHA
jgi:predicted DNA-binding transcriptional regulator YafY